MKFFIGLLVFFLWRYDVWAVSEVDQDKIFKECFRIAVNAQQRYIERIKWFDENSVDWDSLSEAKKSEYRMRNVCLGDFDAVVLNCENYRCLQDLKQPGFWHVFFLSPGLTAESVCSYMDTLDCYTDDISVLQKALSELGGTSYSLFGLDMGSIIADIRSGKNLTLAKIETNNEICWLADGNGDTVWHVLAEVKENSMSVVANVCLSFLNEQEKEYLYNAAFFKVNDQGKTAVSIALNERSVERFSVFGWYFKQEGIDCAALLERAAADAGVDKNELSVLCPAK